MGEWSSETVGTNHEVARPYLTLYSSVFLPFSPTVRTRRG
jgi:hypothetical protein